MTKPWRMVVEVSGPHCGRGSILGPDTDRRTRWWDLKLECGHFDQRIVRYRKDHRYTGRGKVRHRSADAVLPAPKRIRCESCGCD